MSMTLYLQNGCPADCTPCECSQLAHLGVQPGQYLAERLHCDERPDRNVRLLGAAI